MNLDPALAFDSGLGRQIGHRLECANVFLAAIRIAAVIELVGAEEDIAGFEALRQSQSKSEENRISRRYIGDGYAARPFRLRSALWEPRFGR